MKGTRFPVFLPIVFSLLTLLAPGARAEAFDNPAAVPAPRAVEYEWMSLARWREMHEHTVTLANKGEANVVFLGDSITEGWHWGDNRELFDAAFSRYKTVNFGIGGDQTQHVLWRLQNGAIGKLKPELVVLMIGVNNFGHSNHSAQQVAGGVAAIVELLRNTWPDSRVLLLAILPTDHLADHPNRNRIKATNRKLASLADSEQVYFYDPGELFLDTDGSIPASLMADYLHPTHQGYKKLAEFLAPVVEQLLVGSQRPAAPGLTISAPN